MWWKRYIGSPVGISALPRDKLEHLYTISSEQLERMQSQEKALHSEINDITIETTRQLQMTTNKIGTTRGITTSTEDACPANYTASERRCAQLRATISQLTADRDQLEEEIAEQEDILAQYIEMHQVEMPVPKDSLLVGPFNNTDLRKIYGQLQLMAHTAPEECDRDDFFFCLDVLSGESKLLAKRMEEMRERFVKDCETKQEDLDALIAEATRIQRAVKKLQDQMESLTKKAENLRPVMPRVRKDLQNEVRALGSPEKELQEISKEVEELRAVKEKLKEECTTIGAELLLRPLDDVARKNEMEESVQLRQSKTSLDIELHELEQAKARIESNIKSTREAIEEAKRETEEMKKQCKTVQEASTGQKWKFDKLTNAKVSSNDLALIRKWSFQMTPDDMEKHVDQMREHIKLLEKRRNNLKRRTQQLTEQEKQYETQIVQLRELLAAGNINDDDLPA